jgi:hypothetical protein
MSDWTFLCSFHFCAVFNMQSSGSHVNRPQIYAMEIEKALLEVDAVECRTYQLIILVAVES